MANDVGRELRIGDTQPEFGYLNKRRIIRSAKNPMDKCTIVSIFPKEITETKHTIEPGRFSIEAGTYDNPAILVVGSSSWWKEIDESQPMLEIPVSSIQVANSFINDYCNGMLGCDMSGLMPGLFFVLGAFSAAEIKLKFQNELLKTKNKQDAWYKILVRLADSLWARSNMNPLVISDEMRLAARSLNYNDKPWLRDFVMSQQIQCKACGSLKNPDFPVCLVCKSIDMTHPLSKDIKFAV